MIALFALALLAAQSNGDVEAPLSKTYSVCMDRSGGVTVAMMDCIGDETRRQDAELNAVYRRLQNGSSAAERIELRDTQRAWIRARDARCESKRIDEGGGTLSSVIFADCYMTETAERVVWLQNLEN